MLIYAPAQHGQNGFQEQHGLEAIRNSFGLRITGQAKTMLKSFGLQILI